MNVNVAEIQTSSFPLHLRSCLRLRPRENVRKRGAQTALRFPNLNPRRLTPAPAFASLSADLYGSTGSRVPIPDYSNCCLASAAAPEASGLPWLFPLPPLGTPSALPPLGTESRERTYEDRLYSTLQGSCRPFASFN